MGKKNHWTRVIWFIPARSVSGFPFFHSSYFLSIADFLASKTFPTDFSFFSLHHDIFENVILLNMLSTIRIYCRRQLSVTVQTNDAL